MARRRTTRVEDMSYSLLGILDINMPMPYGERQRAFYRLREEVIREYNDLSIFAWTGPATATLSLPRRPASSRTMAKSVARHTPATSTSAVVSTPNSRSQNKASSSLRPSSTRSINCLFPPPIRPLPQQTPRPLSPRRRRHLQASRATPKSRPGPLCAPPRNARPHGRLPRTARHRSLVGANYPYYIHQIQRNDELRCH